MIQGIIAVNRLYYRILNQVLSVEADFHYKDTLKKYESSNETETDITANCQYEEYIPFVYGLQYLSLNSAKTLFFSQKDSRHFLYTEKEDYSEMNFCLKKNCTEDVFMELLMAGFYSRMALKNTLLMHAAAVSYKEKAIVFTAPSGTGKTTQAELWQKYRNALILNGDKVFLKQEDDCIHAWGSPWKGSSPYSENASAALKAIVVLEQDSQNSIRKLRGFELVERVIPHIFFPQWDERCENAVLNFMDRLLQSTDIYLLQCRPDEDAVKITEETIFGYDDFVGEIHT